MGYFAVPLNNTKEELVEAIIANLQLYKHKGDGYECLLTDFAKPLLDKLIKLESNK